MSATRYAVRNSRTGKYLRRLVGWGPLDALESGVFSSKEEADLVISHVAGPRQHLEAVPVELLRV